MRILIATDAWRPQVNGVVRTLQALAGVLTRRGVHVTFLTPDGFPTVGVPTYPGLRCAVPRPSRIAQRILAARADAIHIATEGPIGVMTRRFCLRNAIPFTTSYTTRYPEYVAARFPIPPSWTYAALRRFHAPAALTMVSTQSLQDELSARGFAHLGLWTRGVDTELFRPDRATPSCLPRPLFAYVGRVAVEKNLEAFLSLDLPGSKLIIGSGPQEAELRARFPQAHFAGLLEGEALAGRLASADVFVFPSRTDTFGIVQLEALACGVPVAAYPVNGPKDVICSPELGALDEDLRVACLAALSGSRQACRDHALGRSWDQSATQFLGNLAPIDARRPSAANLPARVPTPDRSVGAYPGRPTRP